MRFKGSGESGRELGRDGNGRGWSWCGKMRECSGILRLWRGVEGVVGSAWDVGSGLEKERGQRCGSDKEEIVAKGRGYEIEIWLRCGRGTGFGSEGSRDGVKKCPDLNSKTYQY